MDKIFSLENKKDKALKANLHFIHSCNAHCRGCFSTSFAGEKKFMDDSEIKTVVINLIANNIRHFNLAGGEPTMHPKIHECIKFISEKGCKVSIITNGFGKLNDEFIEKSGPYLDTLGISVDSFDDKTSFQLGRYVGKPSSPVFLSFERLKEIRALLKKYNIKFKINTVVSNVNFREKMFSKIKNLEVDRWKIIKMSPFEDKHHSNLSIIPTDDEYQEFVDNNPYNKRVIEDNMTNSYLVIDPDGNLLDNRFSGNDKNKSPYRIVGNFLSENATEVLQRYFSIFNRAEYEKRYTD